MQKTVQNAAISPLAGPIGTSGGPNVDTRLMRPFVPDEAVDRASPAETPNHIAKTELEPTGPDEFREVRRTPKMRLAGLPRAFKNDLTPERKEELVKQFSDSMRAELESANLTVNFVARLVNRQHRQVGAILLSTESATEAVDQLLDKTGKYVDRLIAKLTPEQREEVLKKLQKG